MRYKIGHKTIYNFENEVFLEPHYFRFIPRQSTRHRLLHFECNIGPNLSGYNDLFDTENNHVRFAWFDGKTKQLSIHVKSTVTITPFNPLQFLIYPLAFQQWPATYDDSLLTILQPYLVQEIIPDDLLYFGKEIAVEAKNKTVDFLLLLNQKLHNLFTIIYRAEGSPYTPAKSWKLKEGSCRDVAWLMIHLLRKLGLATRFVSGYYYLPLDKPEYELHAWIEVYLPGAGWFGLDPTHGLATAEHHIPLVSSADYNQAMPVTGTFRGSGKTTLHTALSILPD